MRGRWLGILVLAGALVLAGSSRTEARAAAADACGLPDTKPLWIEYGGGQVPIPVRRVLARPGVVLATAGNALASAYRNAGAQTVYFELKLPAYVGSPTQPADPASIPAAADRLYDLAVASTGCPTPRIALNELTNPGASTPWPPETAAYRENVRALAQRLTERGAQPALFIHGNPTFTGEAAAWWQTVGLVSDVVYEAYSKGTTLDRLGRILGPRRVRLGMRSVIRKLVAAGVPPNRIGMAVGFQAKIGTLGREGLQPTANWLRVVKWQALASQQVALDEGLDSIWSWGWGVFSAEATDPDKPLAACVYLWARDPTLCDALGAAATAGTPFDRNRIEGLISLPPGITCVSAAGKLPTEAVRPLRDLFESPTPALDIAFTREVLRRKVPVPSADVIATEQQVIDQAFGGVVDEYLAELARRGATRVMAREAIADVLRRDRIAAALASGEAQGTVATWIADATTAAVATATCQRDALPGSGDFPTTDQRDVSVPPLLASFPFLRDDTTAPAQPVDLSATLGSGRVLLDWSDGIEPDLAGYLLSRGPSPTGPWTLLTPYPMPRSSGYDLPTPGASSWYQVQAVDTSGNSSAASVIQAPAPPPPVELPPAA